MTLPLVIYPMGAKHDDKRMEKAWDSPDYWAERKYDGSRYIIRIENGEVRVLSRQTSKRTGYPVNKTANVPHLVEIFSDFPDGTVFDGEIITHENCTSNEVTSIMGSYPERAIELQKERGWVKYVVFDILYYDGQCLMDKPYYARREILEEVLQHMDNFVHHERGPDSDYVFPAPVEKVNKKEFYYKIVEEGGEGVILKNIHKPYIPDKKPTDTWIKVKKYQTFDVVVLGYTKPTKEYTGKNIENWTYWETVSGALYEKEPNESAEELLREGMTPVTKDYYMGWIGAVEFGQWVPEYTIIEGYNYSDEEPEEPKKVPHPLFNPKAPIITIDGVRYSLVRIGQTDGMPDWVKEEFTNNKEKYIGTVIEIGGMERLKSGAIRHPRFLRFREDKRSEECVLGES